MSSLFSRDGRNLLIISGNFIQLYSIETGALLATLGGHTAPICGIVHHPLKIRSALSSSLDGTLREWDVETGACLKVVNVGAPIVKLCTAILPKGSVPNVYVVVSLGAFSTSTTSTTTTTTSSSSAVNRRNSLEIKSSSGDAQIQQQSTSPVEESGRNNSGSGRSSRRRPAPSSSSFDNSNQLSTSSSTVASSSSSVAAISSNGGSARKIARSSSSHTSALKESSPSNADEGMAAEEELSTSTPGAAPSTPVNAAGHSSIFDANDDVLVMNLTAQYQEALTYPIGNEIACVQTSPPTFAIASALTLEGTRRKEPWSFLLEINLDVVRVSRVLLSVRGFPTGLSAKCYGAAISTSPTSSSSTSSSSSSFLGAKSNISLSSSSSSSSSLTSADVSVIFAVKRSVYIMRGNFVTRYSSKSLVSSISLHPFDSLISVGEVRGQISTWSIPELAHDFTHHIPLYHNGGGGGVLKTSSPSQQQVSSAFPFSSGEHSSSSAVFPFALSGSALSLPSLHPSPTILSGGSSFRSSDVHWHAHAPWTVSFTNDGSYLVSGGEEGTLVLWQLQAIGAGSALGPVKDKKTMTFVPRLGAPLRSISTYSAGALLPFEMGAASMDLVNDDQVASSSSSLSLTTPASPQPVKGNVVVESTAVVASPVAATTSTSLHVRNAPPVMYAVSLVDNSVAVINGLSLRIMWRASGLAIAGLPAIVPRGVALFSANAYKKASMKALSDAKEAKDAQAELIAKAPTSSFFSTQLPSSIYHSFSRHLVHGVVPDPRTRGVLVNGFPGRGSLQLLDVARGVGNIQIDVAQRNVVSRSNDEPPPPVRVTHAALSPDGLHLATLEVSSAIEPGAGDGNTLKFWSWMKNSSSGEFVLITRVDAPHKAEVTVLEFHPFEALVVSGSRDRTFKQWQREAVIISSASSAGKALQPFENTTQVERKGEELLQNPSAKELSGMNRKERRQSKLAGAPMPSTLSASLISSKQQSTGDKSKDTTQATTSSSASSLLLPPTLSQAPRYTWTCLSAGFYRDFPVTAGAFSLDGSVLALSFGHIITLWSPRSNALKRTLSHVVDSSSSSSTSSSLSSSMQESRSKNSSSSSSSSTLFDKEDEVAGVSTNERHDNDDDVFGDGDASIVMGNPNGRLINNDGQVNKGRLLVSATRYPSIIRVAFLGTSSLLVSATKKSIVLWDLLVCTKLYAFDAAVVSLCADRLGSSSSLRYAVVIEDTKSSKNGHQSTSYDCVLFEGASPVPISAWHLPSSSSHAGIKSESKKETSDNSGATGGEDTIESKSSLSAFLSAIPEPPLYAVSFLSPAALSSAATASPFLVSSKNDHHQQQQQQQISVSSSSQSNTFASSSSSSTSAATMTGTSNTSSAPSTPANGILVLGPLNEVYTLLAPPHALSRLQGPIAANATTAAANVLVSSSQNTTTPSTSQTSIVQKQSSVVNSSATALPKNSTANGMLGLRSSTPVDTVRASVTGVDGGAATLSSGVTSTSQSLHSALSRFGTVAAVHSPSFLFEGLIDSLLQPSQQLQHQNQQLKHEAEREKERREMSTSIITSSSGGIATNSSSSFDFIMNSNQPSGKTSSDDAVHDGLVSLFSSILEENEDSSSSSSGKASQKGEEGGVKGKSSVTPKKK
jgi:WD40 repeat protein